MKLPSATLIISTYNWPSALKLVLNSVKKQSVLPSEIIIADDGSTKETKILIANFSQSCKVDITHCWHEDNGFRKTIILNKAISKSKYDYIIQLDGDCILHPKFIADHLHMAKKNTFINGSRVLIDKYKTQAVIKNARTNFTPFSSGIKNRLNATHFPIINNFFSSKKEPIDNLIFKIRGCNMSFWHEDLLAINGYDEDIKGWGREDSEIALRLLKKGLSMKQVKMAAIQYHLYHNEEKRDHLNSNDLILENSRNNKSYKVKNGILKLH